MAECDHKWNKWTDPKEHRATRTDWSGMYVTEVWWMQWRDCRRCGKAEARNVEMRTNG